VDLSNVERDAKINSRLVWTGLAGEIESSERGLAYGAGTRLLKPL
jgi:hypothetical protein